MRIPGDPTGRKLGNPSGSPPQERNPFSGHPLNTNIKVETTRVDMDSTGSYSNSIGLTMSSPTPLAGGLSGFSESYQIRSWMDASTIAGSSESQMVDGHSAHMCTNDVVPNINAFNPPGSLPVSRICSQSSAEYSVPMQHINSAHTHGSNSGLSEFPSPQAGEQFPLELSPEQRYAVPMESAPQTSLDFNIPLDQMQFSGSMEENAKYTSAAAGSSAAVVPFTPGWTATSDGHTAHSGTLDRPQLFNWNTLGMDPYSSSSQSSHPDTPLSMALNEDQWLLDDTPRTHTQLPIRTNLPMLPAGAYVDGESTIRPSHGSQRTPLPGPHNWQPPESSPPVYGSPVSMFHGSRRSSEGDNGSARKDKLYQIKPREDKQYYCIFVDKDGKTCDAEPFRLKCNYDKHLDSHLKPYRCKWQDCKEGEFSSTACLLRHEREAHGMHGHMEIVCLFEGCERSVPGKGFPRKWNAQDHMKRVHQWAPSEELGFSDGSSPSSGDANGPGGSSQPRAKRRSQSTNQSSSKKSKSGKSSKPSGKSSKKHTEATSHQAQASIQDAWLQQKNPVGSPYGKDDPNDNVWAFYEQDQAIFQNLTQMA